MSKSLSSLVKYLSDRIYIDKCIDDRSHLNYMSVKDDQLIFRCFEYKKNYNKDFNKELIKRFANSYEFCNRDINKFILLLRKGVFPYEYIDSWERSDEKSLLDEEAFYSNFNIKGITDIDYRHGKRVFKDFNDKNLGYHHDLYVQSDIF